MLKAGPSLRVRRITSVACVAIILLGPIALAAWETQHEPFAGFVRIEADGYLSARNAAIDALLPGGAGGTHFFEGLGDKAGLADVHRAAIAIAPGDLASRDIEAIELHERGHLLYAAHLEALTRLVERAGRPFPSEYAAKGPGEHVGEMAARAWQLVAPLPGMCWTESPRVRLRVAEIAVPGTAAFVAMFLQHPALSDVEGRAEFIAAADSAVRRYRYEWMAVRGAIEARRRADGTLEPWPAMSVSEYLDAMQRHDAADGSVLGRLTSAVLWPSARLAAFSRARLP